MQVNIQDGTGRELNEVYVAIGRQIVAMREMDSMRISGHGTVSFGRPIGGKKKSCNKGYSCGYGCISTKKACQNGLSGQAKTFADYLANVGVDKLTKSQKKDAEDQGLIKPESKKAGGFAKPPKWVEETTENISPDNDVDEITHDYSVGDEYVSTQIRDYKDGTRDFNTTFEGYSEVEDLSFKDRDELFSRQRKLIEADAANQPDGTIYLVQVGVGSDGEDMNESVIERTKALMDLGFSIPGDGKSGGTQSAIVRNGKLEPSIESLAAFERQNLGPYESAKNERTQAQRDEIRDRILNQQKAIRAGKFSASELIPVNFNEVNFAKGGKKNCSKGYSCGASCINKGKDCENTITGFGATLAQFLERITGSVKNAFKSKAQKEAEALAVEKAAFDRKIEELTTGRISYAASRKGHDLIDESPIKDLNPLTDIKDRKVVEEYKARAIAEILETDDLKDARAVRKSLERYTGEYYSTIRAIESGKMEGAPRYKEDIENLNRYMASAPRFDGELQRGLGFETPKDRQAFVDKLTSQSEMSLDAMSSWTSSSTVAEEFAKNTGEGKNTGVILRTANRSGVSVKQFSDHEGEDEVLVPKGTRYRIKSQSVDNAGNIVIDMEEI